MHVISEGLWESLRGLDLSVKVEDLFVQTGFLLISFYLG